MKIMFIIDQVYLHGGIERVLSIKANYLSAIKENDVYIVTTEQQGIEPCYGFSPNIHFEDLGINYHRKKSYFHPTNLLKVPKHMFRTKKTLKKISPDVVVVCSHSVDTYFMPFINRSIPKVKEFHFSKSIENVYRQKSSKSSKKYFLKFADFVEKQYDKLVVLNPDEERYYKSNNTITIPNPLTFYPKAVSNIDKPIVITAGRIAHVKRFDQLIDIWELVALKNKDWQLHIYGSGEKEYVQRLQQKIEDKKLEKLVVLKGPTDHIKNKMLGSSLFVMTSDNECFPLVLLEAQACGLPIVAFDCPHGPRNIIKNNSGKLVEMQDIKGFSETVLQLIANPQELKKLGKNARENARNFKVDVVMERWLQMFDELIKLKTT